MLILYSLLFSAGFIVLAPYFLLQAMRHGKYLVSVEERSGRLPAELRQPEQSAVWIHAVSVGEGNAVMPLVSQLRDRLGTRKIFVSTTTFTGQQNAREKITEADGFFYFPFDWRWTVRRSLRQIQPALVCLAETELWPNFIHEAHRQGIKIVVVNGRISKRSFRWYSRIRGFLRQFLPEIDLFLMQTEEDAERIRSLGARASNVRVIGNLKYDLKRNGRPSEARELIWQRFLSGDAAELWVAGSTAEGEEEIICDAFEKLKQRYPRARLILAPRRPERFAAVASQLSGRGCRFVRRTELATIDRRDQEILLLDTVGELASVYDGARVAFVGGSLVEKGGHNILEPAAAGVPVVFGPHMSNFAKVAKDFLAHHAAVQVKDGDELTGVLISLFEDANRARAIGERGRALIAKSAGATARTVEEIVELL